MAIHASSAFWTKRYTSVALPTATFTMKALLACSRNTSTRFMSSVIWFESAPAPLAAKNESDSRCI